LGQTITTLLMSRILQKATAIIFLYPLVFLLVGCGDVLSQTVNKGSVIIQPGTIVSSLGDWNNMSGSKLQNDGELLLLGNFNNDGTVRFTDSANGLTRFEGTLSPQRISGDAISYFKNLRFNHSIDGIGFELSNNLDVAGNVEFLNGIVLSDGFGGIFSFSPNANHSSTSDASFIDGYVQRSGQNVFRFPVGDANYYRFAELSSGIGIESTYKAKYFYQDDNSNYPAEEREKPLQLIDDAEYWELTRVSGDDQVVLTLSWRDVTTPAFILGQENELHVAKWDESISKWVDQGGVSDVNSQTVTASVSLESSGVFTLATVTSGMTNLHIEKSSLEKMVWQGETMTYELIITNNSQIDATNVVVVDNLPAGLVYESSTVESLFGMLEVDIQQLGQTITWTIPLLQASDKAIITLLARPEELGAVLNYAEVKSAEEDEDYTDNSDTDENTVRRFFIPNVITPNGDGQNDYFEIKELGRFAKNRITIVNRLGDHLFEEDDYQNNWEAKGLVAGTYFYILTVEDYDGKSRTFKGWIQVLRE